jgi:hypothetical protein
MSEDKMVTLKFRYLVSRVFTHFIIPGDRAMAGQRCDRFQLLVGRVRNIESIHTWHPITSTMDTIYKTSAGIEDLDVLFLFCLLHRTLKDEKECFHFPLFTVPLFPVQKLHKEKSTRHDDDG